MDLNDQVLDALDDMNFTECTPIQEHAIPVILEGRDLIGVAQMERIVLCDDSDNRQGALLFTQKTGKTLKKRLYLSRK